MQVALIHEHGGPEVLRVEDVEPPTPAPDEVLVRVLAVSVNHLDLWVRRGMPGMPIPLPRILGCDGTGEVVALGEEVAHRADGGLGGPPHAEQERIGRGVGLEQLGGADGGHGQVDRDDGGGGVGDGRGDVAGEGLDGQRSGVGSAVGGGGRQRWTAGGIGGVGVSPAFLDGRLGVGAAAAVT